MKDLTKGLLILLLLQFENNGLNMYNSKQYNLKQQQTQIKEGLCLDEDLYLDKYSKAYLEKKPYLKKYYPTIFDACKKIKKVYTIPPVIVLALIEQESKGNRKAISDAGACGLTQIIPETGKELGMEVYIDENYWLYKKFWNKYRKTESLFFKNIKSKNAKDIAYTALKNKYMAKVFIEEYKKNLRKSKDDRFSDVCIYKGVEMLAYLLKKHKGNLLFALAEYNAGPIANHYGGIPPFEETVKYISKIMKDLQEVGFDKFVIEKDELEKEKKFEFKFKKRKEIEKDWLHVF